MAIDIRRSLAFTEPEDEILAATETLTLVAEVRGSECGVRLPLEVDSQIPPLNNLGVGERT